MKYVSGSKHFKTFAACLLKAISILSLSWYINVLGKLFIGNILTSDFSVFLDSGVDFARVQCCSKAAESRCWRLCVQVCTKLLKWMCMHAFLFGYSLHESLRLKQGKG